MDVRCSRSRLTSVILPNPANGSNPELVNGQSPANSGTLVTRYDYRSAQLLQLGESASRILRRLCAA
ncbi:MAG: hypothetical protein R3F18_04935 [Lysobacterales bacterium]